jgi:hypothetical protein
VSSEFVFDLTPMAFGPFRVIRELGICNENVDAAATFLTMGEFPADTAVHLPFAYLPHDLLNARKPVGFTCRRA